MCHSVGCRYVEKHVYNAKSIPLIIAENIILTVGNKSPASCCKRQCKNSVGNKSPDLYDA